MFKIFVGFGFIFFNLSVGKFDLLADFLGYGIILWGINDLKSKSPKFKNAVPIAVIMVIYTFITEILKFVHPLEGYVLIVASIIGVALRFAMAFFILSGINDIELYSQKELGSRKLMFDIKVQSISNAVLLSAPLLKKGMLFEAVAILTTLLTMIFSVVFLIHLYKAAKLYKAN